MRVNRLLVLFLLNFLATTEFWNLFHFMTDEAVCTVGAQRLACGEWPYRDWDSHIPPGSYIVGALWYLVWGWTSPSARLLASLIWAFTGVAVQLSAERLLRGRAVYLPWLLWTCGGVLEFPILSYHWMATCALAWVVYGVLLWVEENRGGVVLGVASACAGWFLQSEGLAALLAVLFVSARWRLRPPPGYFFALLGSSLILFLPALAFPGQFVEQVLLLKNHLAFNHFPYSWQHLGDFLAHYRGLSPSQGWVSFLAALSHCELQVVRYGSYPLVLLGSLFWFEKLRERLPLALVYVLLAWTLALSNRLTVLYLGFLSPGWVLLLTLVVVRLPLSRLLVGLLVTLEVGGWGVRWLFRRQHFVYAVTARTGTYYFLDPVQGRILSDMAEWLQPIPPGTPVAAVPYLAHIYTLFRLRNPIREDVLVPLLQTPEQIQRARETLIKKEVPYVLWAENGLGDAQQEYLVDPDKISKAFEAERRLLTEGYELEHGTPNVGLYRRRE